jgi:hypothetical protein
VQILATLWEACLKTENSGHNTWDSEAQRHC